MKQRAIELPGAGDAEQSECVGPPPVGALEGYARLMASWWDTDTAAHVEPVELLDLGTHAVLLSELSTSTTRLAGGPLTRTYASVWTLQDGKIRTVREYTSHDAALEAAGLPE